MPIKLQRAIALAITITLVTLFSELTSPADTTAAGSVTSTQKTMTTERFRELAAAPGDSVPLEPKLASVPFWTNAIITNVTAYATGKVAKEVITQTARTEGGKFVVFTLNSELYHQAMDTILAYDEKASALKAYALYSNDKGSDMIIESTIVYDYGKKTYTMSASYDGYKETTKGSYASKEDFARTSIYKDDLLFLTREVTTRPVNP